MELTLSTYFKTGFAIGTNDSVFSDAQDKLKSLLGKELEFPANYMAEAKGNKEISNRLGNGLVFDISDTSFVKEDWCEGAKAILDNDRFQEEFDIKKDGNLEEIKAVFPDSNYPSCRVTIFSCGIATLELKLSCPEDVNPVALFRLGQAFEFSGYSDSKYDCNTNFQASLLKESQAILETFIQDPDIRRITTLPQTQTDDFKYNFFLSSTIILNSESEKAIMAIRKYRADHFDDFLETSVDGRMVYTSWYTVLINGGPSAKTVADLIRVYNLFHGACEMMESIMNNEIYELLAPKEGGDKLNLVIKLQVTGNLIINNTTLYLLSQNEEIKAILNKLDNEGKLDNYHQSIKSSLDACVNIQKQFNHEVEKKEEETDKKRDNNINFFVILFTSLTFISVAADFIGLNDRVGQMIGSPTIRWSIYIGVFAFFIIIIRMLFNQRGKRGL